MTFYSDTSFLCSLYRVQAHSDRAYEFRRQMNEPIHFTNLLEFEFLQSIELQVWLNSNDRTKGYRRKEADRMIADWEKDRASGLNVLVAIDHAAVLKLAGSYSSRLTARGGHRTLDVLHVATAVHLGASKFLSFDDRQRKLAKHAGLEASV